MKHEKVLFFPFHQLEEIEVKPGNAVIDYVLVVKLIDSINLATWI